MEKFTIVNPIDNWKKQRYVLAFGEGFSCWYMLAWGHLEECLDECIDYIAEHAPGLLCDDEVNAEYHRLVAEGMSEEKAQEQAEVDTTCAGNCGNRIQSDHWTIVLENPTRQQLKALIAEVTR
jgi:hypothetical protein